MKKMFLLIALLLLPPFLYAEEVSKCIVKDGLIREIDFDIKSKSAIVTDLFGTKYPGKIILTRKHNGGENKLNIVFEYTVLPNLRYVELIVTPILGNIYRIGLAGYIYENKERYLDISGNDEAECS